MIKTFEEIRMFSFPNKMNKDTIERLKKEKKN